MKEENEAQKETQKEEGTIVIRKTLGIILSVMGGVLILLLIVFAALLGQKDKSIDTLQKEVSSLKNQVTSITPITPTPASTTKKARHKKQKPPTTPTITPTPTI